MNDRELERKVDDLFTKLTPDISNKVLRDLNAADRPAAKTRRRKSLWLRLASIAAAFMFLAFGAIGYAQIVRIDSTVTLDVNPSIEICVNRMDRVLRVTPLNADGKTVIGTMRLNNVDLDVAVNALIGSMMKNGYLSKISNSILITVDSSDEKRSRALSDHVSAEVESMLSAEFSGAVLSQTASNDETLKSLADENSITIGKAQLIQTLIEQQPLYSFDELSKLSINELNVLLGKQEMKPDTIQTTGSASTSAYIGEEQALMLACTHVGLDPSEVELTEPMELEYENGKMVYDVEFRQADSKYEFEIDAVTGEIVSFEQKQKQNKSNDSSAVSKPTSAPSSDVIGEAQAKENALRHAGISADKAKKFKCDLEREKGNLIYEVEFTVDGYEYEYTIDAQTGDILHFEKESDD